MSAASDLESLCDRCNRGDLAEFERLLRSHRREQMHDARDDAGPSGLMARAEAGAVVAVEVLVEQHEIAPVRIVLELFRSTVDGSSPFAVAQEDGGETSRELLGDLIQRHLVAGPGGA